MAMVPSEKALALIRRFEGCSLTPYTCPAGKRTIGYGHVIRLGEAFPESGISKAQAENLLRDDIRAAGQAVNRYVRAPLTQPQFDALTSFIFNVGAAAFSRSTLKAVVNKGWHGEVPGQMMRWVHAGGLRLTGLEKRRAAEAMLYRSG